MEIEPYSQGAVGSYGRRFGINRNTWRAGQTIGRAVKNWWDSRKGKRKASGPQPAMKRAKRPAIRQGLVMNEGTGGQYSMFTGKRGKSYLPKHVENALPPLSIQSNAAAQLKSPIGKQASVTALTLFPPSLATTYTGDKISRVVYDTARGDVTINNIYLANAYVIIYDIVARKDVGSNSFLPDPQTAWYAGAVDESNTQQPVYLGSTPFAVEVFNQYYKVKQMTNVVLGAGATHVHKVRLSPKRSISSAYAQYTPAQFKDLTYFCMIEVHGSPANDTVTQTSVSIGAGGLNIVTDQEHILKQLQKATPSITITNNLSTGFANAEQVVNLGGSTITTNAEG